ncbi:MAG: DDE-type integrase/transposase/recombinase [Myxococcales bacterium]|nr:DDE-type integrase/transposase/recombinase [Myxococcales bacterium]
MDFKGWWRAANSGRCDPLCPGRLQPVRARHASASEYRSNCRARRLRRLFRKHGLPIAIQCDNGTPFVATNSRGGLTTLSAWWVSLGIRIVRSRPGCPQDSGGHERMHRDVSADVRRLRRPAERSTARLRSMAQGVQ